MSVNPEAIAKLIEATMKDSEGHRAEILERAGEEELFEDYNDLPKEVQPYQTSYGLQMIEIFTGGGQRFVMELREDHECQGPAGDAA